MPSGYVSNCDALLFLGSLRDGVADVVFLDPPFNLGKDYGRHAHLETANPDAYDIYMRSVLRESVRVLRAGGALFLYHLPTWAIRFAPYLSDRLEFRHWIAIAMKNGFARGDRLYPAHYALLYFTRGNPLHFKRPHLALRTCRHCNRILKDYGGYRAIVESKGVNLSDVWDDISPVRHVSTKLRSTNQLPSEITDRVCAIAGAPGLLLVDPFAGTGTSLLSAQNADMHFIGNDLIQANVRICVKRLAAHQPHTTAPL